MKPIKTKQKTISRRKLLTASALLGVTVASPYALAQRADDNLFEPNSTPLPLFLPAEDFIATIAGSLLLVAKAEVDDDEKKAQYQALLETYADIPTIAEFSLGRYASSLTDDVRENYYSLVAGYISRIFVIHSSNLAGRDVEVLSSRVRDERETLVESRVWFESGRSLPVVWRVISTADGLKVFDVSVNDIWLAIQQRAEFVAVITENNGDLTALLEFLTRNN